MRLFARDPEAEWEHERLQRLAPAERKVVHREASRRACRSWRVWAAIGLIPVTQFLNDLARDVVNGAGGGELALYATWLALHIVYVAVLVHLILPLHRRIMRELLLALEAHEKRNREPPQTDPNSAP